MTESSPASTPPTERPEDASLGQLVAGISSDLTVLVRDEMQLARAEMQESARNAGIGAGMFGGASVVGLYAFGVLIAAGILGLAEVVPAWTAALIVAAALFAITAALALVGKARTSAATPPLEATRQNVARDKEALKGHS